MSVTFDDAALVPSFKKAIMKLSGVKSIRISDDTADMPNEATRAAIEELRSGKGFRCKNVDDLFAELNA
ncbi:MAG: hypothetical protein LBT42_03225 [Tannerella sp.]|nr:hypothetical protein [Tannerella sp.]